ncbi:unnamed protein product [Hymenolepis diminuta]|uniref:Uncharacterized protein n=1 Tax=Hymenolepis diminuta TaxID=6216 RepID=A0A3P6ZCX3_HYMDI|nr:unnamed protein product [Hymenolepis diminuta]
MGVGGPDQHPINGSSRESLVENASKDVQSPTETKEAKSQIELPKEKPLGEKEIIARWLASSVSPTPGRDEEFEELRMRSQNKRHICLVGEKLYLSVPDVNVNVKEDKVEQKLENRSIEIWISTQLRSNLNRLFFKT